MTNNWTPHTWKEFPVDQQPDWPNSNELENVLKEISSLPPLVFAGEARTLQEQLGQVCTGTQFFFKQETVLSRLMLFQLTLLETS